MATNSTLLSERLKEQAQIPGLMPNLFEIQIFGTNEDTGNADETAPDATLFCSGYDIPSPSMEIKQNLITRKYYASKYSAPNGVTITWQEDSSLSVWNYHQDWYKCFYDRNNDVFISNGKGTYNRKRRANIVLQKFNVSSGDTVDALAFQYNPLIENFTIELHGLLPKAIPTLKGAWDSDAEKGSTGITLQYSVDYIVISSISDNNDVIRKYI